MRFSKWLSLMLVVCMLACAPCAALSEENEVYSEGVDLAVGAADSAGEGTGLDVDLPGAEASVGAHAAAEPQVEAPAVEEAAPAGDYRRVTEGGAPVYCDTVSADVVAYLGLGEVVIASGEVGGMVAVAFNAGGQVYSGFMEPAALEAMDAAQVNAYQDDAALSGGVALYNGDIDLPLSDVACNNVTGTVIVANANYVVYSNDTKFTMNGKQISANMLGSKGSGNCWAWARGIYEMAWGVKFNETFEGKVSTGYNLLRNLTDAERKLTVEHLKNFANYTMPGATIRVCGCTTKCSSFDNDGLACGHNGHSLIIAEVRADGIVTLDDTGTQHTRFYTWEGFCNSWRNFPYIKYIKWPNASPLPSSKSISGYEVRAIANTYRPRATAANGVGVYSAPENGKVKATLAYPATFTATQLTTNSYGGYTWAYGATGENVKGWLPLTKDVVNVKDTIAATGVTLNTSKLVVLVGASSKLTATVTPADATSKDVTWSSGNSSVARVSGGTVTGVGEGTCTVTVKTKDGKYSATCEVQVVKAEGTKTLSRTGSNGTVKMMLGQRMQLVAQFATKNGWKLKSVKLSKANVIDIDKNGLVTAKGVGKTVITVNTKNKKKATLTVEVYDPYTLTGIKLNKTKTVKLKVGGTVQLQYKLNPTTAVAELTWRTTKSKVATIDENGRVTAVGKGTCYVGIQADNGKYARVKVKVS